MTYRFNKEVTILSVEEATIGSILYPIYYVQLKSMTIFRILLFTLIISGCSNKASDYTVVPEPEFVINDAPADYHLLFIGNSLTYSNNLPQTITDLGLGNDVTIAATVVARGNYALIDHWNDGVIQPFIETGLFDYVIVQQGPSSQPEGRQLLLDYGQLISDLCTANNSQLAYYMVWPALENYNTFDGVIESYTLAAEMNNDLLCPVGAAWKSYITQTNDFSYYGPDGFHPSVAGSQVAAEIIYNNLGLN